MSSVGPTARGSLAATPFAHLLIYALDHRLKGTIVFEEPNHAKHAIHFVDGAPAQARTQGSVALLGELVVERGRLAASELDAAVAEARASGSRLGDALVLRGVLAASELETLLREQVLRRLEAFVSLPAETAYGFYENTNFLEHAGGPLAAPFALGGIWRVIRRGVEGSRVRDMLARHGDAPLRFHADAPLARFEFSQREQAVVDVLRAKPQSLAELIGRGLSDPGLVELLVYALSALRHFDTGSGAKPVGSERASGSMRAAQAPRVASPAPQPAMPVTAAGEPVARAGTPSPASPASTARAPSAAPPSPPGRPTDALRQEITERLASTNQSYYEVLGVAADAPSEAIASAFFQLAKRFHPDRLGSGFEDVQEQATRLFARMTEAHQVLSDPTRRKDYDELVKQGEGSADDQEEVLRVVRAATSFQKAQVHLKRNNLKDAETEARAALADDPEQADHVALVAWLDASKPNPDLEAVLKVLDDCVRMEELNLRVRWYRGQILKRLGHERRALEDFRYIVERDARNVDAQRELRLHELRRGATKSSGSKSIAPGASDPSRSRRTSGNPPPPEKPGFFGKLFKK
jgi:curved DNA-binding protein CbpA